MSIWESLQALPFEAKAAIAIPAIVAGILWVISEVRHEMRHRQDHRRIERLDAANLLEKRAIIELLCQRGASRGAAVSLGSVVHEGPTAGQHFTGAIKNSGPHMAENIRVTGTLGAFVAEAITAPHILAPHSQPEPLDIVVPFRELTYMAIMDMIRAGEKLRVWVGFKDGTPGPSPVEQCFDFRLEQVDESGGTDWVSRAVSCSGERGKVISSLSLHD